MTGKTLPLDREQADAPPAEDECLGRARPLMAQPSDPHLGTVLDGRYRIDALVAVGGMGSVYRAEHVRIGRKIAVKILHPEFARSPTEVERFRREAQIAVRLASPHVVEVLDCGQTPRGELYLAMELLGGESLRDRLSREGRFPPGRVADLLRQLLRGLVAAHGSGIVHRDLKPENLWLVPSERGERLKILDFGIAKVADSRASAALTQVGVVVGTPEFLAPEQAVGGEVDHRADLYSTGIIAWVLLTGRHPFPTADTRALIKAHAFDPVPSPEREIPELVHYPALLQLIGRATEKDRTVRAQSASELLDILEGREIGATHSPGRPAPTLVAAESAALLGGPAPTLSRTISRLLRPVAKGTPRALNLTLLLSEIVAYAQIAGGQTPEETARMLTEHDWLLLPAIRSFHGRRIKPHDATVVAAFTSPTDAVLCGMAIQDRLAERNASVPAPQQITVRLALHLCETQVERGDLAGEPLEMAVTVRRLVPPGEVWLTRSVYLAMNHSEVPVEPILPVAAKEGSEPIPVYRVQRAAGPLPYGGREASRVKTWERLTRAIRPIVDGVASIEDGAAEGRIRATLRVTRATAALLALGTAEVLVRLSLGALLLIGMAFLRRPMSSSANELVRRLERLRQWIRLRRPIRRAELIRPLS